MKHALYLPCFGTFGDVHLLVDLAVQAEQAGWDGFFLWDHILYTEDVPFTDPWVVMSAIAAKTSRLHLSPIVTPLARRRPWKVAREAVTLDHLTGGRFILGVGLGVNFFKEFEVFGPEAAELSARAEIVDESLEVIRQCWTGEPVRFSGKHFQVDGPRLLPKPVQSPIPIWSAIYWPARPNPIRRAAGCEGVVPFKDGRALTPGEVEGMVEAIVAQRGSIDGYDVAILGPRDRAAEYEAVGTTWLLQPSWPETPVAEFRRGLELGPPR